MKLIDFAVIGIALMLFIACNASSVICKPMASASLDEAVTSELIVIASYQEHEPIGVGEPISSGQLYMRGVNATYKIVQNLKENTTGKIKGPRPGSMITVNYAFHDFSPCMPDQSFHFTESMMPARESRWILFLNKTEDPYKQLTANCFSTYRGKDGRLAATTENIQQVRGLIDRSKGDPHHYQRASSLTLTFASDDDFSQLDHCEKLETLYLNCTPAVTGKGMAQIHGLTSLTHLVLSGNSIDDQSLVNLSGMSRLTSLSLLCPKITDGGIEHLKGMQNLDKLLLTTPRIDGTGLKVLRHSTRLSELVLNDCSHFTDSTVSSIGALTSLRTVQMSACQNLTDAGLAPFFSLTNLRDLKLESCPKITGTGLKYLSNLPHLAKLSINNSAINDRGLQELKGAPIEDLDLTFCQVTDKGIAQLIQLPNLSHLAISNAGSPLTDESAKSLPLMPKLRWLNLNFSKLTDQGVAMLTKLPNLEHLGLHQTKIGTAALGYLEQMPKLKDVEMTSTAVSAEDSMKLLQHLQQNRR